NFSLTIPVLLYLLMLLSATWSIDPQSTYKSLLKELPLLLIPLAFMLARSFTADQKQKLIAYYSYGILLYAIFYIVKAMVRFAITNDSSVFFYHELVTKDVNAIHVSVYVAVAFFYFFRKAGKSIIDYFALLLLLVMVFLLSSKNIIVAFVSVIVIYYLFYAKISRRLRMRNLALFILFLISLSFVGKIRDRFIVEYETNMAASTVNDVIKREDGKVYNVSIKQAWTNETFQQNDYFPGTAFRVYQLRIFTELIKENDVFFTGFGLNASYPKIAEKGKQYNIFTGSSATNFEGYQHKNFHNQYVQNFAELGVFGFLLLLLLLAVNLRTALKTKDLTHFAFAFLMISLFLTESFLWRQRGVVFFTMMYCLYNSETLAKTLRKEPTL
ncbi:MAG TPA: O-antigen ligase family protein, partial [Flavobacterium sp.]|nr:O-antigen ligase family protein [Flavobacterium sp.]